MAPSTVAADSIIHHNLWILIGSFFANDNSSASLLIALDTSLLLWRISCSPTSNINTSELGPVDPALAPEPTAIDHGPAFAFLPTAIGILRFTLPYISVAPITTDESQPVPKTLPITTESLPTLSLFVTMIKVYKR